MHAHAGVVSTEFSRHLVIIEVAANGRGGSIERRRMPSTPRTLELIRRQLPAPFLKESHVAHRTRVAFGVATAASRRS